MGWVTKIALIALLSIPGWSQGITVAAAADLNAPLSEIAANYQKQTGMILKLSFGSSGNLFNQIQNGAPYDVFLSAFNPPARLVAGVYAIGRLVLWTPESSLLDVEHRGMDTLLDPAVKKIAIANPQHAPYGGAAVAALRHYGIYEKVADRLVLGENVSQAAQFVESGNAQVGVVALAHALAPTMQGKGRYWEIPADSYPTLHQAAIILSRSSARKEAVEFLNYLKTSPATDVFRRYGFSVPKETP